MAAAPVRSTHCSSVGLFGLPPIERDYSPRKRRRVKSATTVPVVDSVFGADPNVPLGKMSHSLSWTNTGPYSWQIATNQLVADATRDILADTGLSDRLQFFLCGFDLFRPRRDLFCLFRITDDPKERGPYVGAVLAQEGNAIESHRTWARVFDILCMLKAYHGAEAPLVIVSTYAQWRVFWLGGDGGAGAFDDAPSEADRLTYARANETLCAGPIMQRADIQLVPAVATAMHKMYAQTSAAVSVAAAPSSSCLMRLVAKVNADDSIVQWVRYPSCRVASCETESPCLLHKACAVRTCALDDNDTDDCEYLLIEDMGAGGDGHAWKAHALPRKADNDDNCDRGAVVVVVKFGHECNDAQPGDSTDVASGGCLWRESLVWRAVWGVRCARTRSLCGWPALVMPCAHHVADSAQQAIERGVALHVLDAIQHMAAQGLCHDDLYWRHVGWVGPRPHQHHCLTEEVGSGGESTTADQRDGGCHDISHRQEPGHGGGDFDGNPWPRGRVVFFDLARVSACQPDVAARRMKKALGFCFDGADVDDTDDKDKTSDGPEHDHDNDDIDDGGTKGDNIDNSAC